MSDRLIAPHGGKLVNLLVSRERAVELKQAGRDMLSWNLTARQLCREVRPMFVVAPVLGLATAVISFVIANRVDLPPAQLTVALQGALLAGAWGWSWARSPLARS